MLHKLKNLFSPKPEPVEVQAVARTTAIIGTSTKPLVVNPDASAKIKQQLYRKDAIERYVQQTTAEKRIIPDKKMQELNDEYQILLIELRRAGEIS